MRPLSLAFRKMRTATNFSFFELILVLPVVLLLGIARIMILTLPFRTYAGWFGDRMGTKAGPPQPLDDHALKRAASMGTVVRTVAKLTPWKSLCLAQAMVIMFLMRMSRLPHSVYFGLASGDKLDAATALNAHAWVMAGDTSLTGGYPGQRFTVVMIFQYPTSAKPA